MTRLIFLLVTLATNSLNAKLCVEFLKTSQSASVSKKTKNPLLSPNLLTTTKIPFARFTPTQLKEAAEVTTVELSEFLILQSQTKTTPTFENTIAPYLRIRQRADLIQTITRTMASSGLLKEAHEIFAASTRAKSDLRNTAHWEKFMDRIEKIDPSKITDPDQKVILEDLLHNRSLPAHLRTQVRELSQKLIELEREFTRNVTRDEEHLNPPLMQEILALRAKVAELRNYDSWTHYRSLNQIAGDPDFVLSQLRTLKSRLEEIARPELEAMRPWLEQQRDSRPINRLENEVLKFREETQGFDGEALRDYFELNQVLPGLFKLASEVFGIQFIHRPDIPSYHQDAQVYEVRDGNRMLGILHLDLFARPGEKRGGNWTVQIREQHYNGSKRTPAITLIDMNLQSKNLNHYELRMLAHELGHSIHTFLSDVRSFWNAGIQGPNAFVEFPSNLFERLATSPTFMKMVATHRVTGDPLPEALLRDVLEMDRLQTLLANLRTVDYSLLDLHLHLDPIPKEAWKDINAYAHKFISPYLYTPHSTTSFDHVFGRSKVRGIYYIYLWSSLLGQTGMNALFKSDGKLDQQKTVELKEMLSKGDLIDHFEVFQSFTGAGKVINIEAYLEALEGV